MRHGELVGDGAARFYEAELDGALPPQPDTPVLPDEDTFRLPAAWHPLVAPHRGHLVRPVTQPEPAAVERAEEWVDANREWLERTLTAPRTDPALVQAARAYLAGAADPLGAAVVSRLLPPWRKHAARTESPFVDAWVVRHGLAFAARAVVGLSEVHTERWPRGSVSLNPVIWFASPADHPDPAFLVPSADRIRELLAAADEPTYRAARAALEQCRSTPQGRAVAAYLAPGTPGWADDCVADAPGYGNAGPLLHTLLLRSLDSPAQVDRLGPKPQLPWNGWSPALIATLAERLGTACVPFLGEAIKRADSSEKVRSTTAAVAQFPTDDAFRLLLARLDDKHTRPALKEAMERYPVRATRLLAAAALRDGKNAPAARQLLTGHLTRCRPLLPQLLPHLDQAAVDLIATLGLTGERVAEASPEELPPLLVAPPWTRKRTPRPRVLAGLQPDPAQLAWLPGEREQWDRWNAGEPGDPASTDWAAEATRVMAGERRLLWVGQRLLLAGPAEVLAPWLESWRPTDLCDAEHYLPPVIAKYGLSALPTVLFAVQSRPAHHAPLLLPFRDVATARFMADGLGRSRSVRSTARSWFARHAVAAALLLVPDAVGAAGPARRAAEQALRLVAADAGAQVLQAAVADCHGAPAAELVAAALAADPLESALPARLPALPAWLQPDVLPPLLLTSGAALPEQAVRHVLTVLALGEPGEPYPGLAIVREACRPDSLAEFAWALFEEWRQADLPAKESWTMHALGVLGNDETVRRFTPVLRDWPGQGGHTRAVAGLGVLAGIGSDLALLHLHGLAQRVKFKALRERAQEKISEIADGLGLSQEQLADRLVPDLGLDAAGSTVIDYGPRRFTVGFDEQLRPFVLDPDGRRRKDLPAPGARDDQELAPAERKRFAALKKDVRTVAADQIHRLEAAMVAQRSWTATEFRELLVRHPLLRHLVRRLVWLAQAPGAAQPTAFRVAEDATFADVDDDAYPLPGTATVRLAHPLHLGEALPAWSALFADYQILQPFAQLARPVHRVTPEEAAGHRLDRFKDRLAPLGRVLGLTKRGWERGEPQDAGWELWISKRLGDRVHLIVYLSLGICVGSIEESGDQTLGTAWLATEPDPYRAGDEHPLRFGDLDPVTVSELLADLAEVTAE
ncbi:DUF4132 domain-containing protein [Kitasatospora sp. LaBMicrA B282]|uniref:DUF4132 domain-containing protein n=1 Tax=Kitasatospora sp. LaBMicrA B282 TaxID=3420949 RepID=UPI003D0E8295